MVDRSSNGQGCISPDFILCSFPRLPYQLPQTWWLKQGSCILKDRCQQSFTPSQRSRGENILTSSTLSLWLHGCSSCSASHRFPFAGVVLWVFLMRMPVIGFRAHLNLGWITTEKILLPSKVTSPGARAGRYRCIFWEKDQHVLIIHSRYFFPHHIVLLPSFGY